MNSKKQKKEQEALEGGMAKASRRDDTYVEPFKMHDKHY